MQQLTHQVGRRRSREQWQELVNQFEQSGLSQRAFCDTNGIKYDRLGFWRRRFRKLATASDLFIELPRDITSERPSSAAWDVELDLGNGTVLRLRKS